MVRWSLEFSRGKSGLHWKKNQVTPGKRKLRESATENIPPYGQGWNGGVRAHRFFGNKKGIGKPFLEQGQIGMVISFQLSYSGRLLEVNGNIYPRLMIIILLSKIQNPAYASSWKIVEQNRNIPIFC